MNLKKLKLSTTSDLFYYGLTWVVVDATEEIVAAFTKEEDADRFMNSKEDYRPEFWDDEIPF